MIIFCVTCDVVPARPHLPHTLPHGLGCDATRCIVGAVVGRQHGRHRYGAPVSRKSTHTCHGIARESKHSTKPLSKRSMQPTPPHHQNPLHHTATTTAGARRVCTSGTTNTRTALARHRLACCITRTRPALHPQQAAALSTTTSESIFTAPPPRLSSSDAALCSPDGRRPPCWRGSPSPPPGAPRAGPS